MRNLLDGFSGEGQLHLAVAEKLLILLNQGVFGLKQYAHKIIFIKFT